MIPAPTNLQVVGLAGDSAVAIATWVCGDDTTPLRLMYRKTGVLLWRTIFLAPTSTTFKVGALQLSTQYDFQVVHGAIQQGGETSTPATAALTTRNVMWTLPAPTNPVPISGGNGVFGMSVIAQDFPGQICFEVALETAPEAGTYGDYVQPSRGVRSATRAPTSTTYVDVAPSDGLRRRIRAKAVRMNAIDSPWTPALDVTPGGT